jgi:ABC-type multidrug transport system ATPase subunit
MNYVFESNTSTALLGVNGSGKSTLLQIIASYVMPSKGEILFRKEGQLIDFDDIYHHISYCAPYLELIEEMTLIEFLNYHFSFKKTMIPIDEMMQLVGLRDTRDKLIEKFSSGMKQRVKLAQALFADTSVLLLDEPCSNLDAEGIAMYRSLITQFSKNKTLLVASNDADEYSVCANQLQIGNYKL